MHILSATKKKIELELVQDEPLLELAADAPRLVALRRLVAETPIAAPRLASLARLAEQTPIARASRAFFRLGRREGKLAPTIVEIGPAPAVFREPATGIVRTVYREIVLRFRPGLPSRRRRQIVAKQRFEIRRVNPFVPDQVVIADRARKRFGAELVDVANDLAQMDEVIFATPNFVSEYRRHATPTVPAAQWHLRNLGRVAGQKKGEDVDAPEAWRITRGKREVVVALVDDGVDVEHPELRSRVWKNPRRSARDRIGRDFFLPDDHPDHYNPRPKKFVFPFDQLAGNDIHGTPCAGVAVAAGPTALGIAPRCRVLAVKVFHGDDLAPDERVADAIRYAARHADVLSCSWSGGQSPDLELALVDAGRLGRRGLGSAVLCAAGNDGQPLVGYPAADPNAIAVGATTDMGRLASYSNTGPEIDVVAPSSGGKEGIFTIDVAYAGRGFNVGLAGAGGKDGLHTNEFGGTSSATPLAAGIAALVLSVNPKLDREELRGVLRKSADKIGSGYDAKGHSNKFGYGRVNAAQALVEAKT